MWSMIKKMQNEKNSEFPFCSYTIRLKAHMTDGYGASTIDRIYLESNLKSEFLKAYTL